MFGCILQQARERDEAVAGVIDDLLDAVFPAETLVSCRQSILCIELKASLQ